jgi:hypothetical protein
MTAPVNKDFVRVSTEGTGPRVQNVAIQTWVDHGDGNGPQLVTVFLQATAIWPVDPTTGVPVEADEFLIGAEWKRQMLDELRAVRLGMQRLTENRRDMVDSDQSLIDEAQEMREEIENDVVGSSDRS